MDVNDGKFLNLSVPHRGHLLETVIYNRIRHFGGTFKYEAGYQSYFLTNWIDMLHQYILTCLLFGNKKTFDLAFPKII